MRGLLLFAGAALVSATPAAAGEKAELACVQNGYSAQQRAEVDGLLAKVDILGEAEDPAMDALGALVIGSASACATTFDWDETEFESVMLFEFGRLLEIGFRRHGNLTRDEIGAVDEALAQGDRSALWAALEEQLGAGMATGDESVSDENAEVFGLFILETGLGLDDAKAEQVGVYLAAKAMQRFNARQFTAQ